MNEFRKLSKRIFTYLRLLDAKIPQVLLKGFFFLSLYLFCENETKIQTEKTNVCCVFNL